MPRSIVLAAIALLSLPACLRGAADGSDSDDASVAEEASDSLDTGEVEAALLVASTDAAGAATSAEEAAEAAAGAADAHFRPAGCATAEVQGTTVTYTLNDCTGPFGVARIDGTVQVSYSLAADGLHATLAGDGVSARGATLDLDAEAVYTVNGSTKSLTVTTAGTAVGPRGHSIEREGSYVARWEAERSCLSLDGSWSTRAGARTWSTQVSGFERCVAECPAAGGTIELTGGRSGVTVTINFDGSDSATWSSSSGPSGTLDLACGG
ncbi:hypothetical protein WME79_18755 [Sorangium sp. So ce726]|uniref:hypothetical protein n=1 Tax=Sorangium sp. So ce726 TaxID=3133319 RepID=UPI003F5DE4C5